VIEDVAEIAVDALADLGSLAEPRKRRPSGCWWLAVGLGLTALVVFIVIALNR